MRNFISKIRSKIHLGVMYSELKKVGGLSNALNNALSQIESPFRTFKEDYIDEFPFTFSVVKHENKFSQIFIAAKEKLYLADFWKDGVCLAHGKTKNILELARALNFWLGQEVTTKALAKAFKLVEPSEKSGAFDEGNEVDYTWHSLLQEVGLDLHDFIQVAAKDSVVNKLFPFTSLYMLCFSRCTGYPFETVDLPNVTSKKYIHFVLPKDSAEYSKIANDFARTNNDKIYVVTKNKIQYLGEGNAEEALAIVRSNLPDNIEPAIRGTANG